MGAGSGGAVGRRREASHQAGTDGRRPCPRLVPGNPGLITRTSCLARHGPAPSSPGRGRRWQETDPFGWLESGGLRNPCHSQRRLPPFFSSPLPSPASASSHLSCSPLPAHRAVPLPLPLSAFFRLSFPWSHSSLAPPAFSLFKSILSQRSGWKNAALGTAGRNALVSGLFLPTRVEAAESLEGTIPGTQVTHALHPNTDPAPLLCGHPAATCDLRLRKAAPFLSVVHLGTSPQKP